MLISQLSQFWRVDLEYSFGWLVPVLSAYLFLRQWRSRPEPGVARSAAAKWIYGGVTCLLLPTWVITQPNPDWRLLSWLLAAETVTLSLCALYFLGGRPWLRHFGFCVCLIFAGVPWPDVVNERVIQALTRLCTALTVTMANGLQIKAVQHGNLIELSKGIVGIDEACSGIQSLQAALMLSLFFGELYKTSILRRSLLLLCSALVAVTCNTARTLLLTGVAAKEGAEAMKQWHDPVGYIILSVCFLGIWGIARSISGPIPSFPCRVVAAPARSANRPVFALGGWILFTVACTEIWYDAHQTKDTVDWSVVWPTHKSGFADIPISTSEARALLFDEGRGVEWVGEDASHWAAYFFRWAKGPPESRILAREHRPENCFPGAGYKLCADHGTINVETNGFSIPFHFLDFENQEYKEYVFFCLWEEGLKNSEPPRVEDKETRFARLRSVLVGQRNLGQQTLEVVISGYDSPEQAETAFRREMASLIQARTKPLVVATSD